MATASPRLRIGFILAPRFTLCAFANFVDVLRLAADEGDRSRPILCSWRVLSPTLDPVESSCGVRINPEERLGDPTRFDYIVVVGGLVGEIERLHPDHIAFLRRAAEAGVSLAGVCTGAFILHRAGLMNGYRACVSWFHHEDFLNEFDGLTPVSDQIFVVDRDRLSCSGGASSAHLAAFLVDRHIGPAAARKSLAIMIIDEAGADILLVGDSLGMVVLGYPNTLPVTLEDMIYHCRAVGRGARRAQIVGDMPFMTYQESVEAGIRNAGRLMKEGGCHAVKLEGGAQHAPQVRKLTEGGIPVMAHIGLTPQSVNVLGGFKTQGQSVDQWAAIEEDARLEEAGAFAVVMEMVPGDLARIITSRLTIPTIGIGAGPGCDGQVLVWQDAFGLRTGRMPRFVRQYADLHGVLLQAARDYAADVKAGTFPAEEHTF